LVQSQSGDNQQFGRGLIPPADESKLVIITKYGCHLDALLPQRSDQFVDCDSPWLGGAIIGFPVPNGVDVDTRGIGELLLRQPGECSRGA
jgi:hypothetical protein